MLDYLLEYIGDHMDIITAQSETFNIRDAMPDHIRCYSHPYLMSKSDDPVFHERVRWATNAIIEVFASCKFVNDVQQLESPEQLVLSCGDLTDAGRGAHKYQLLMKWMKSMDDWSEHNPEIYIKTLMKRACNFR